MKRRSAENLGNSQTPETAPGQTSRFGESQLSFSVNDLQPCPFPGQDPNESATDYKERQRLADQSCFMVGLLKAETAGADGMREAMEYRDFRIRRTQRRELRDAIAKLSFDEYVQKIENVKDAFTTDAARDAAMEMAYDLWSSAQNQALDTAFNQRFSNFAPASPATTSAEHTPPVSPQSEVPRAHADVPATPRIEQAPIFVSPARNYRSQKHERRWHGFFGRKKSKASKSKQKPASDHQPSDDRLFHNTSFYQDPTPGQYFGQPRNQNASRTPNPDRSVFHYPDSYYPPSADSWDVWGGQ